MKSIFLFVVIGLSSSSSLWANTGCLVTVNRTPCPGKESVAHIPYGNRNPITSQFSAKTNAKCQQVVNMSAINYHKGILAKIEVTGTFDGVALTPMSTTTSCQEEAKKVNRR